ncbi:MAG: response regulator [Cyanobacteria bacterium P01_A01_bin.37]
MLSNRQPWVVFAIALNDIMFDPEEITILIVDDNPTNIRVLLDFLEYSGFKLAIAKNAESAFAKAERISPDLIILDIMMPDVDGFEACQHLKKNPKTAEIPIIFMTARVDEVDKVKGLKLGAVDYITKPLHNEEVLARINVHLSLRYTQTLLMAEVAERRQAEAKLQNTLDELKKTQLKLIQAAKMSSLGQVLAGIAHEINNPTNFIYGNIEYAKNYIQQLLDLVMLYKKHYPSPVLEIQDFAEELDLDFLISDLPGLLESMTIGATRIRDIVTSLKNFSRQGEEGTKLADLHVGIDNTIKILSHRLAESSRKGHQIQLVRNYGESHQVECYANQLNQVFMNILVNAIDALDSHLGKTNGSSSHVPAGKITILTELSSSGWVTIQISDNGPGISDAIKAQLFDPFFTTKPVGSGTGLGLSISYQIIVKQHQGSIECLSSPDKGTTFVIKIPSRQTLSLVTET